MRLECLELPLEVGAPLLADRARRPLPRDASVGAEAFDTPLAPLAKGDCVRVRPAADDARRRHALASPLGLLLSILKDFV